MNPFDQAHSLGVAWGGQATLNILLATLLYSQNTHDLSNALRKKKF